MTQDRQPIFNIPAIIVALLGLMGGIHAVRSFLFGHQETVWMLVSFAFIPARYGSPFTSVISDPAMIWTPLTYSLLHADWSHIVVNSIWFLAFGTVVARRFGTLRFIVFCIASSFLGALAHFAFHSGSLVPMLGASAVVSGCMGAAVRFAFPSGGRFSPQFYHLPAQSLIQVMGNRQVLMFVAIWFAINLVFGLGGETVAGEGQSIAWEAHIGGFLCGLLLFSLFDPWNARGEISD